MKKSLQKLMSCLLALLLMVSFIPLSSTVASARTTATTLGASNYGQTLSSGGYYVVSSSITCQNYYTSGNGLTIPANSTVVIEVRSGCTLYCYGGGGSGRNGGGAGIYLPSSSTLILIGQGTVYAQGGGSGSSYSGSSGGSAYLSVGANQFRGGSGGSGGSGAGGAGAGIGGSGGYGGSGGSGGSCSTYSCDYGNDRAGGSGSSGSTGNSGTAMGTLYVLGAVTVTAYGGGAAGSSSGGGGGSAACDHGSGWNNNYTAGGGGGGGGGGGTYSASGIGGGTGGGGGGGGGGAGGTFTSRDTYSSPFGYGGSGGTGGYSGTNGYRDGHTSNRCWDYISKGTGGGGGSRGGTGGSGTVYKSTTASSTRYDYNSNYTADSCNIYLNGNGGTTGSAYFYYGSTSPYSISNSSRTGYILNGYYTASSGGTKVLNANGSIYASNATNYTYNSRWNTCSNTYLYAQWTPITYYVAYYGNGNTSGSMSNSTHTYDTYKNLTANSFVKTGYYFNGWNTNTAGTGTNYSNQQSVVNLTSSNGGTVNLYAKWLPNPYTVVYNANTGTGTMASSAHTYDASKALNANTFTKTGYTFVGWNTAANGSGTSYANGASVKNLTDTYNGSVTLYAQWAANDYTIAFNTDGGTAVNSIAAKYDTSYTLPVTAKTGYSFVNWFDGTTYHGPKAAVVNLTAAANGTVTLKASWSINQYTVSYDTQGGDAIAAYTANYATEYSAPTPTKTGYIFKSWTWYNAQTNAVIDAPETIPAYNVKAVASWTPITYNVKFDTDGGEAVNDITATYDAVSEFPEASKTGYSFVKWINADGTDCTGILNLTAVNGGEVTLKAVWSINQYTVAFDNVGDSTVSPVTQDYATSYTMPENPEWLGYTFVSWTWFNAETNKEIAKPATIPAYNVKAVANWRASAYTIHFELDGGTGEGFEDIPALYGTEYTLPLVSKQGYNFTGWSYNGNTYEQGATVSSLTSVEAATATLTATWSINQYTVTYDTQGGTTIPMYTADYATAYSLPEVPTKTGYEFNGWSWYSLADDSSIEQPAVIPDHNIKAVANWAVNHYTLSFDTDGGTPVNSVTKAYDESHPLDITTKTGYTFVKWVNGENEYAQGAQVSQLSPVDGDTVTLAAVWSINQYSISYDTAGGEAIAALTGDYATPYSAPVPVKTGYTFIGWTWYNAQTSEEITAPESVPAYDVNAVAAWRANTYTVAFDTAGGTAIDSIAATYDETYSAGITKRVSYNFVKWLCGEIEYAEAASFTNLTATDGQTVTLTAVWKVCEHEYTPYTTENDHHVRVCTLCSYVDEADCTYTYAGNLDGTHVKTCTVCSDAISEACADSTHDCICDLCGDALEHPFGAWVSNNNLSHTKTCTNCGYQVTAACVDADCNCVCDDCEYSIPHDWDVWFCHNNGKHSRTCKVCSYREYYECEADASNSCICATCDYQLEHTYTDDPWTANGDYTHTKTCTVCAKATTVSCIDLDMNCVCDDCGFGYEHIYTDWSSNDDATHSRVCKSCGRIDTAECSMSEIHALGDSTHSKACTDCGYKAVEACTNGGDCVCDICAQELAHTYSDAVSNGDKTHTTYCTICNKTVTVDCVDDDSNCVCDKCGFAFEHNFFAYHYNDNATCLADGSETSLCMNCKKVQQTRECSNTKYSHRFTVYVNDHNATCTEDGTQTAICDLCGVAKKSLTLVNSKTGHSYQPKADADSIVYTCSGCDDIYTYTFNCNGGAVTDIRVGSLPEVSYKGYTFNGWFTLPEGGERAEYPTAQGDVTLYAQWTLKTDWITEDTPQAAADYSAKIITGLVSEGKYLLNGSPVTASAEGTIAIADDLFGSSITLIKTGDGENSVDSTAQIIELGAVPAAPAADSLSVTNPTDTSDNTAVITGLAAGTQYSTDGGAKWTDAADGTITVEAGTTVLIRVAATDSAPASAAVTVNTVAAQPPVTECDCACHKSGFIGAVMRLIYKALEIFGIKHACCDAPYTR